MTGINAESLPSHTSRSIHCPVLCPSYRSSAKAWKVHDGSQILLIRVDCDASARTREKLDLLRPPLRLDDRSRIGRRLETISNTDDSPYRIRKPISKHPVSQSKNQSIDRFVSDCLTRIPNRSLYFFAADGYIRIVDKKTQDTVFDFAELILASLPDSASAFSVKGEHWCAILHCRSVGQAKASLFGGRPAELSTNKPGTARRTHGPAKPDLAAFTKYVASSANGADGVHFSPSKEGFAQSADMNVDGSLIDKRISAPNTV